MFNLCVSLLLLWGISAAAAGEPAVILACAALNESSGLAEVGGRLWSHNDSGDSPRFFVFEKNGDLACEIEVDGSEALDWEDMCAFERDGHHFVAVGDVGDNGAARTQVAIYVLKVPDWLRAPQIKKAKAKLSVDAVYAVTYPTGPVDCESLCYDSIAHKFVLATKEPLRCRLFELDAGSLTGRHRVEAKLAGTVVLPLVTAADISPDGQQMVLATYGPGCLLQRGPSGTWQTAGDDSLLIFALPTRRQGESICFDPAAEHLWLSSEFLPTPLLHVPVPSTRQNAKR